jgi:cytidylate kinase
MGKVIAIDGPSGAGKSTIAKIIAERLGFQFLDTGALYRAVALYLRKKGINPEDSDSEILEALKDVAISFNNSKVLVNNEDVSTEIRSTEIGHYASVFSARKPVRDFLFNVQRKAAINNNIVAEGRDMTTVVFPDAWKKFYLDASLESRAERRFFQLKELGINISIEEAIKDVRERDIRDSSRDIAPLRRSDDSIYIDTTSLSMQEVIEKILNYINKP